MSGAALAHLFVRGVAIAMLPALLLDADVATARVDGQARERVLYASAFDDKHQPVPNLGPDAFVVREDGTRREVLRVAPATTPQSVAIIIDNSQAVAPAIADLRKALTTFLTTIDGIGPVAISTVADRPTSVEGCQRPITTLDPSPSA